MDRMKIAYTIVLCLLLAAVTYARPQQQEEPNKPHEAAPAQQQHPEAKPEGPERKESAKPEKSEKEAQQEKRSEKEQQTEKGAGAKSEREQNGMSAHARPAGKSAHIPDEKFRSSFGRQHSFSVGKPTVINNQPAFQYGGYTFEIIDAWPTDWAYTDDVYIDYVDGDYFLYDLLHPGMRIAVFVVE